MHVCMYVCRLYMYLNNVFVNASIYLLYLLCMYLYVYYVCIYLGVWGLVCLRVCTSMCTHTHTLILYHGILFLNLPACIPKKQETCLT